MERAGFGKRLAAAILDWIFISIVITVAIVVFAVAGGTRFAFEAQRELGIPITFSTLGSDALWNEFERESERMIADFADRIQSEFTDEQAEFIARTMADTLEGYVQPENISLDFILSIDARVLDDAVDQAFDAVVAADRPDIPAAKVNALRADTKELMDRFALGRIVPAAIRFVVWLVLLPLIVVLAYGFAEAICGRSPGKLIVGIAIERSDEGPAVPNLMLRYAVKFSPLLLVLLTVVTRLPFFVFLSGTAFVVIALGSLVMLGPERRALHDYVAGTIVSDVAVRR